MRSEYPLYALRMDATAAGLIGALSAAAIVGGISYLSTRTTIQSEWRKAHEDRLMDRRADSYRGVCVFVTRLNGFVRNVVRQVRGEGAGSGPSVPDDDEWSVLTGTLAAFGSESVRDKFKTLHDALGQLAKATSMSAGIPWIGPLPETAWDRVDNQAQSVKNCSVDLVDQNNKEMTEPARMGRRRR